MKGNLPEGVPVRIKDFSLAALCVFVGYALVGCGANSQTTVQGVTPVSSPSGNGTTEAIFRDQAYQKPENCLPCHQRQYDELHSSVKSGYRNVSPLFNALETSGNLLSGGLLRPVYADSKIVLPDGTPLNTNMFTTPVIVETRQDQAGFCFTCHNAHVERLGDDPMTREVPQLPALQAAFDPTTFRPLRDYAMEDSNGNQVIPAEVGGFPPPGIQRSLGGAGISCDFCHNVVGPDLNRSFQQDGFANMSLLVNHTIEKTGPFLQPVGVNNNFHVATSDSSRIAFLRSSAFCNACHDVRVPNNNLTAEENNINPGGQNVKYFRLENLSTEWQTGAYNSTNNPFAKVVRCQDCHMSSFPFGGNSTYQVGDLTITSPTPGVFFQDYAAVPGVNATADNQALPLRQVVTHYFAGVDVPLLPLQELQARQGATYPDPNQPGVDTHGIPNALEARREALLKAAVRIDTTKTDANASVGQQFTVRVEAVSLTGHRFPAGFSQERTAYIELEVTDANGFLLYQSGYVVDKPHPQTGEMAPDGNLDDEDIEHVQAVVNPGTSSLPYVTGAGHNGHNNMVFVSGPDNGPDSRLFSGAKEGLVLFRNELTHIALPGESLGRLDANGKLVVAQTPHFEETFSASFANAVDNYRSLQALTPTTYEYEITLPTAAELAQIGVTLKGPLHVHAQVNFEHFPPLFMRFLAATTGPNGPTGHDVHLVNEALIDSVLKNIRAIATSDTTVNLGQ